ncbi:His-Xaa-Ser repeat protein HxsA [Hartmannibacter diazotrophicus]|uniref:His-Xaa-Ser repeat protein HxsA n=1 Tax=Hartmannibacter diazotrophicus TaxID=1482074 RepID=A0A2C9D3I5_9HYPH|nr:peptidoglycan-binding domain-containing protein [Hartmannibacter diazotrophicus]SON54862.1 His-Xaa-Ser repeat protein HxsA [Hartmannibacter diazotrophicus]
MRAENYARRGFLVRGIDALAANPTAAGGAIVMIVMASAIITNAIALQPGQHPNPLFKMPRIVVDGDAGPATTQSISATRPDPATERERRLVAEVQQGLRQRGYYDGVVDGVSGPMTGKAILAFERAHSLQPTGEPSPDLMVLLRALPVVAHTPPATVDAVAAAADEQASATATATVPLPRVRPQLAGADASVPDQQRLNATLPPRSPADADVIGALASQASSEPASATPPASSSEDGLAALVAEAGESVPRPPARSDIAVTTVPVTPASVPSQPAPVSADFQQAGDPRIASIQEALNRLGFGPLVADGLLSPQTRDAIGNFEAYRGLPKTGMINAAFLKALVDMGGLRAPSG